MCPCQCPSTVSFTTALKIYRIIDFCTPSAEDIVVVYIVSSPVSAYSSAKSIVNCFIIQRESQSVKTAAIIQARMGSSRLPGKMMLPLAGSLVLYHDINRVSAAKTVDETIVATTNAKADDIIARYADQFGATVYRGSEEDVLGRMIDAADTTEADVVVRITGDCPLISPEVIDAIVSERRRLGSDYCSNTLQRTFPRGLDTEVVTFESLSEVHELASEPEDREHVTRYYHTNSEQFDCANFTSKQVFDEPQFENRSDIRITLDEAGDYEVLREIYENVRFDNILDIREAIKHVDDQNLMKLNENITQKSV